MIPLRDENPTRRFPAVTLLFIAANAAVFLYQASLPADALLAFIERWAIVPSRLLADPASPREAITILSAMFMHGGWLHIIGNMLYLWIFGNNVEDRLGHAGFAVFYLVTGAAATAAQVAADPASAIPMVGASGGVAGILGAYLVLYPRAAVLTAIPILFFIELARLPAFLVIGFWFVLQLGNGLASLDPAMAGTGGVAWFAHIGGFVAGLGIGVPFALHDRRRRRYRGRGY